MCENALVMFDPLTHKLFQITCNNFILQNYFQNAISVADKSDIHIVTLFYLYYYE